MCVWHAMCIGHIVNSMQPDKSTRARSIAILAGMLLLCGAAMAIGDGRDDSTTQPGAGRTHSTDAPASPLAGKRDQPPLPEEWDVRRDTNTTDMLHKTLLLIVLVAVLGGACWLVARKFLPRFRQGPVGRRVRVLETTPLNTRQAVHLLEVGTRRILVASTRETVTMLSDVTAGFEESDSPAAFPDALREAEHKEPE